jgi:hypothetical protein
MLKRILLIVAILGSFIFAGGMSQMVQAMGQNVEVPRMTKEELKDKLGHPDVVIIDVRVAGEWKGSNEKIQGAVREDPEKNIKNWAEKYSKDKTLVFYCT